MARGALLSSFWVILVACGGRTQLRGAAADGAPPPQQVDGIVLRVCAPNDGPAYDFQFGSPAPVCPSLPGEVLDIVSITVWSPLPAGPGTYAIGDGSFTSGASAYVCTSPQAECSAASRGTLVLTEFSTSASGSYSLVMGDGTVVAASFSNAPLCPQSEMCG